jgi:hypothetical protein
MNDERLTKELEEALGIEPSPQFLARVRRQIEAERRRPAFRWAWATAGGMVAAAVVVIGIVVSEPEKPAPLQPTTASQASRMERLSPVAEIPATSIPSTVPAPKVEPRQPGRRSAELEVLIDPRDAAALQSFLKDIQERKIDPERLEGLFEAAAKIGTTTIEPMPIAAIEPIVIVPLSQAAPEAGGDL